MTDNPFQARSRGCRVRPGRRGARAAKRLETAKGGFLDQAVSLPPRMRRRNRELPSARRRLTPTARAPSRRCTPCFHSKTSRSKTSSTKTAALRTAAELAAAAVDFSAGNCVRNEAGRDHRLQCVPSRNSFRVRAAQWRSPSALHLAWRLAQVAFGCKRHRNSERCGADPSVPAAHWRCGSFPAARASMPSRWGRTSSRRRRVRRKMTDSPRRRLRAIPVLRRVSSFSRCRSRCRGEFGPGPRRMRLLFARSVEPGGLAIS